eukprot:Pgem_evm1s18161
MFGNYWYNIPESERTSLTTTLEAAGFNAGSDSGIRENKPKTPENKLKTPENKFETLENSLGEDEWDF